MMRTIKRQFLLVALALVTLLTYVPASLAVMTDIPAETVTGVSPRSVQWAGFTGAEGSTMAESGPRIALARLEQATLFPSADPAAPRPAAARMRTTEAAAASSSLSEGPRPISAVLATLALVIFFFVRRLT